jgi:hypothetical protein
MQLTTLRIGGHIENFLLEALNRKPSFIRPIIIIIIIIMKNLEAVPGKHSIESIQKTAILGTSHIIRKVLQCEA